MSKGNALGFIESVGLASAIAAADAALKAANVELIGRENSRGFGYITIKIVGEVGAVQAAISAAKSSSAKIARVWSTDVIPRPSKDLGRTMVWNKETQGAEEWFLSREPASSLPAMRPDAPLAEMPKAELVPVAEPTEVPPQTATVETAPEGGGKAEPAASPEKTEETTPRRKARGRTKKTK